MQNSPMNNAEWNDGGTKGRRDEGVVNNCRWRGSGLAAGTCQIGRRNAVRARRVSGGNREQGTGNRVPGTGNRKAATSPRHCRGMRGGNMQKGKAAKTFPIAGVGIGVGCWVWICLPAGWPWTGLTGPPGKIQVASSSPETTKSHHSEITELTVFMGGGMLQQWRRIQPGKGFVLIDFTLFGTCHRNKPWPRLRHALRWYPIQQNRQ
jgi:hypothetical protein